MENQQLVCFSSRQCSSTPVGLVSDFLAKNSVTTLQHSSYSTDLDQTDFYLFPGLTPVLKVPRFCDAPDIIKNATEELKRVFTKWLPGMLQHLYSNWQQCVFGQGDYFEK